MSGPKLLRLARRMQRVGRQQQTIDQAGRFDRQHTGLAAAVGVTAQPDLCSARLTGFEDLLAQSIAVAGGIARPRRTVGTLLAIRQIVSK